MPTLSPRHARPKPTLSQSTQAIEGSSLVSPPASVVRRLAASIAWRLREHIKNRSTSAEPGFIELKRLLLLTKLHSDLGARSGGKDNPVPQGTIWRNGCRN